MFENSSPQNQSRRSPGSGIERTGPIRSQRDRDEVVSQLAAGIAHDLNNNLQVVLSSLRIARSYISGGRTDGVVDGLLGTAVQSVDGAVELVNRLVAFARPHQELPESLDINSAIVAMEDMLRSALRRRIGLQLRLAGNLPKVSCDRHGLESALLNLVINSRDAMPEGGLVRIRTSMAQSRRAVRIRVTDTGRGMGAAVLCRACDPFWTTKADGQGTGLGLAMVRRFVEELHGAIRIGSLLNRGTSVMLDLPLATGDPERR